MKSFALSLLAMGFLFVSCKNETKATDAPEAQKADSSFTVKVKAVVEKDDNFQIFYNEDGSENFDAKNSITVPVKGSAQEQEIVFKLPEAAPLALRFDIGATKDQKQVAFKGIDIEYFGKSIKGDGKDVMKFFYPNSQVEFDTVNNIAKMKTLDAATPYDPSLGSSYFLNVELKKLYE